METTAVKRTEIQKPLSILPQEKLQQVSDFVEFVLFQSKVEHKTVVKLGGIWKNLGFEKIDNLEGEIRKIRQEASRACKELHDRLILSTAKYLGVSILTSDQAMKGLNEVSTIWQ